jgi:uncharacterized protein (TIGR00251 family)
MSFFSISNDQILIDITVIAGSSLNEIVGIQDSRLKIKIAAQPQDGKANNELKKFLARQLGCSKSSIKIVKGEKNRNKTLAVPATYDQQLSELIQIRSARDQSL